MRFLWWFYVCFVFFVRWCLPVVWFGGFRALRGGRSWRWCFVVATFAFYGAFGRAVALGRLLVRAGRCFLRCGRRWFAGRWFGRALPVAGPPRCRCRRAVVCLRARGWRAACLGRRCFARVVAVCRPRLRVRFTCFLGSLLLLADLAQSLLGHGAGRVCSIVLLLIAAALIAPNHTAKRCRNQCSQHSTFTTQSKTRSSAQPTAPATQCRT